MDLYTLEKMTVSIRDLLDLPGLGLTVVAGGDALDHPVRWVHTSELLDPTPWLSGGELLLTTGMALKDSPAVQRSYLKRLVGAGLAGLGFGVGFGFDEVPEAIVRAADRAGFPLLEVPYPVPFLAISEAVSSRLSQERLREAQMSVEVHERLAALVTEGSGPADVLDEVVTLAGGWAMLFGARGQLVGAAHAPGAEPPDPALVWGDLPKGIRERRGPVTASEMGPKSTTLALVVTSGRRHEGVLVFGKGGRLDSRERIVVHHALTVLSLLLSSRRAVVDAERRIAGDILGEAFAGRLAGADLERRLELVGFPSDSRVTVLTVEQEGATDERFVEDLTWAVDGAIAAASPASSARTTVVRERVCALVRHDDPEDLAESVLRELKDEGPGLDLDTGALRIGVGEIVEPRAVRQSYLSSVLALRAAGANRQVASPRDLGSYGLLLGAQPRPVLEGFVGSVLGPLIERDRTRSSELVESVRAFIEAGGRWEPGAEALGVHRHTLRYRVRQVEELLGRDLTNAEDRMEIWLALKAADLLDE